MSFKIVLNDETKRVAKIPESFVSMIEAIKSAFKGKCPASFVTKYIDSDGDYITVASKEDFALMVHSTNGNIKVFIYNDPLPAPQNTTHLEALPHSNEDLIVIEEEPVEEAKEVQSDEKGCLVSVAEVLAEVLGESKQLPPSFYLPGVLPHETREEEFTQHPDKEHSQTDSCKNEVRKQLQDVRTTIKQLKKQRNQLKGNKEALHQLKEIIEGLKAQKRSLNQELGLAESGNEDEVNLEEISADWLDEKLRGAIEDLLPTLTERVLSQLHSNAAGTGKQAVHCRVRCDGCNMHPIVGPRFKCTVCDNFDFCSNCEANRPHPHSFIKINHPSKAPRMIFTLDQSSANTGHPFNVFGLPLSQKVFENSIGGLFSHLTQELNNVFNQTAQSQHEDGPIIVEYEQVGVLPNEIRPNRQPIRVDLVLKNTGLRKWPKNLTLHNLTGLNSNDKIQVPELGPGASHKLTISFENPQNSGKFSSVWRLGCLNEDKVEYIGPEITLNFEVLLGKKRELPPQSFSKPIVDRAGRFTSIFPHLELQKILPIVKANMRKRDDEIAELLLDL